MISFILNHAWSIFGLVLSILVLCFVPIIIELLRIVRDFRNVADRIDMLTDIRGWLSFAQRFKRKSNRRDRHGKWWAARNED